MVKHAKRVVVTVAGLSILCLGLAMIVLPGPAIVVIPIGLGILPTEFVWAMNLQRLGDRAGYDKIIERSSGAEAPLQQPQP